MQSLFYKIKLFYFFFTNNLRISKKSSTFVPKLKTEHNHD